jgi:tetratricopeptide (TPR) repeat protein
MAEFQEALALEPDRAEIPARIAQLYSFKMQSGGEIARLIPEVELWALRAIELDSGSVLGWGSLYNAERYRVRPNHRKLLETAFRASRRSEHRNSNPQSVSFYSVLLGLEGYRYQLQFDPLNSWYQVNAAVNSSMLGRHDESLELVDEALQIDLDFMGAKVLKPRFLIRLDRFEEARGLIADLPPMPDAYQAFVAQLEFLEVLATGDANAVRENLPPQIAMLLHSEIPFTFRWPYMAPSTIQDLATNGYVEESLDVMSQLHEAGFGDPPYDWLRLSPMFDPIRDDPRFQAVEAHAKENFDLMLEQLDRARESGDWPAELEQARVDLIEQLEPAA